MAEPVEHGALGLSGAIGSVWRSERRVGGIILLLPASLRSESIASPRLRQQAETGKWAPSWALINNQWVKVRREDSWVWSVWAFT